MQYSRYPSYKDSRVEWLGEIPEHWEVSSLKYVYENLDNRRIPISAAERETVVDGYPYYGASGIIDYVAEYIYDEETILVGEDGANLLSRSTPLAFIANGKYWVNNHAHILRFKDKNHFYWSNVINSLDISPFVSGSAQPKLTSEALGNLIVSYPKKEQERKFIANYLDNATAKIDTLIEKQTKLIELLKEKRQAVISTAVTRGLDSTVAMKDSGVEWLGEIPEGWLTPKLKLFITTTKGFAFKSDSFIEKGIPVVKMSEIKNGTIKESSVFLPNEFQLTHKQVLLKHKDIVVSTVGSAPEVKNSAVGQIGIVPLVHDGSLLNQNTVIFSPNRKLVSNDYLPYILKSQAYREHLDLHAHGTANQASLNLTDMLKFVFPFPPLLEQMDIVNYLDDKTSKIDSLITKATKAIDLLKEKRTALISSVVTGKIDVRREAV